MELLVISVLTTILVSAAFTVIQLVNAQFAQYEKESRSSLRISNLQTLLQEDVSEARFLYRKGTQLECRLPEGRIIYDMHPEYIIRRFLAEEIRPDTFWMEVRSYESFREREPVDAGWVDQVQIRTQKRHPHSQQLRFSDMLYYHTVTVLSRL